MIITIELTLEELGEITHWGLLTSSEFGLGPSGDALLDRLSDLEKMRKRKTTIKRED